jgi:predicted O-methyltransferase YrrM
VRALVARRLLELGTSNGYSTLWLGDAAQATGGAVTSIDVDPQRTAMAARNLERACLHGIVELRSEDAGAALRACGAETFDFIFLDAERSGYVDYWEDLVRVLARPGALVVDNVISHARELVEFRGLVTGDRRVASTIMPVGAGTLIVTRER